MNQPVLSWSTLGKGLKDPQGRGLWPCGRRPSRTLIWLVYSHLNLFTGLFLISFIVIYKNGRAWKMNGSLIIFQKQKSRFFVKILITIWTTSHQEESLELLRLIFNLLSRHIQFQQDDGGRSHHQQLSWRDQGQANGGTQRSSHPGTETKLC